MDQEFYRELNVRDHYRNHLHFLRWFLPLLLVSSAILFFLYREQVKISFIIEFYLVGILTCGLFWATFVRRANCDKIQSWSIVNGRAIHKSPSSLLGDSFDIPLNDIILAKAVDECNTVKLDLTDGNSISFLADNPESNEFYNYIKQYLEHK